MKDAIAKVLEKYFSLKKEEILLLIETPRDPSWGDYALPCFVPAKKLGRDPVDLAKEIITKIKLPSLIEKLDNVGPYLNIFINKKILAQKTFSHILKEKEDYGSSNIGKNKTIVIEMSSPNIAKPFGIGHLRSTIIGNALANIFQKLGFKTIKINYLGDWGTSIGKIIAGYKKFGNSELLKKEPLKHFLEIYVKVNEDKYFDEEGRIWFKKMEEGDKEALRLWKTFRSITIKELKKIYTELNISFDVISGESENNNYIDNIVKDLEKRNLIKESEGAHIVDLEKYGLGVSLIKKSDGATLYVTRDIAAAITRYKKYNFYKMFYEVGAEQKLHFQQLFKILSLLDHQWAENLIHISHGLYLDKDQKKFATREGKTIFMEDILKETKQLAKEEILKREETLKGEELEKRASAISRAAIFYGDLKNYREQNMIFDISRFVSFEGDTGPYLLYTYARAKSILAKAHYKTKEIPSPTYLTDKEKELILKLNRFQEVIIQAYKNLAPNLIAIYAFHLSQTFNEFYHTTHVIGSDQEQFRLSLVAAFSQVLKNALNILGISTIERM